MFVKNEKDPTERKLNCYRCWQNKLNIGRRRKYREIQKIQRMQGDTERYREKYTEIQGEIHGDSGRNTRRYREKYTVIQGEIHGDTGRNKRRYREKCTERFSIRS